MEEFFGLGIGCLMFVFIIYIISRLASSTVDKSKGRLDHREFQSAQKAVEKQKDEREEKNKMKIDRVL